MPPTSDHPELDQYTLEDRYRRERGRVFLSGTQALVSLPLMQAALDRRDGRHTAGFITGYRGSPLGAYDQALWGAKKFLVENRIEFLPAVNEDLAATAVIGTQQVEDDPQRSCSASGTARDRAWIVTPQDFHSPASGLHYRWPDFPGPQVEARMVAKVAAMRAFARANPIDRRIYDIPEARFGIITTGKAHLDLMEALALLGVDEARARAIGIDIYKIGMVWPLETEGVRAFLRGKEEVLVVEEKRGIIESELKEFLYDYPGDKPRRMVGKYDESGNELVPWIGELSPTLLVSIVARRIVHEFPELDFSAELAAARARAVAPAAIDGIKRLPFFCAGCPHNTYTKVPEDSRALAGIGCHFMASWMGRRTGSLIQMGGEGVNWVGKSRFTGNRHVFQNLGEGTYFHSGYMAIRQALAANLTWCSASCARSPVSRFWSTTSPARPRNAASASAALAPIRSSASSSTNWSARAAAIARCNRTACRSIRWKPGSAASDASTRVPATRITPA